MALYRTYRPATFAEVVGQEHVTEPLSRALDSGRINHAYLFSGPRGCGKTSSARILARSLNCEQGPTSTPCGTCASCVALAPGGPGNLDVTEMDAASHGGVDDARELRDRAFYAPAESRYRVFILDEAHMVTSQGFNALLKIVEEPPPHIKFIFATTEPDKVIGTIRSRTHHYPFRLLAPPVMRSLLESICAREGVTVAPEVFPLVIRAGGGSPRDSLSILDQLLAGADENGVTYERALALLGVTDTALIDGAVDALAAGDGPALFDVVERVVDAGHDPRRFAMDLLDRFRDLLLLQAVPDAAERGLVEAPEDQVTRMKAVTEFLGLATLTRYAEVAHEALGEMRGTTSPRLLLEVMCARLLLPAASSDDAALLQRIEALELRPGAAAPGGVATAPAGASAAPADPVDAPPSKFVRPSQRKTETPEPAPAAEPSPVVERVEATPAPPAAVEPAPVVERVEATPAPPAAVEPAPVVERVEATPAPPAAVEPAPVVEPVEATPTPPSPTPPPTPAVERVAPEPVAAEPAAAEPPAPTHPPAPEPTAPQPPAAQTEPEPEPEPVADVSGGEAAPSGLTPAEVTARFADFRGAVRNEPTGSGKVLEAMLSSASVQDVADGVIVLSHPHPALVGRLTDARGSGILNAATAEVFGPQWQMRVEAGQAGGAPNGAPTQPSRPEPKRQAFQRPSRPEAAGRGQGPSHGPDDGPPPPEAPPEPEEPWPSEPPVPVPDEELSDAERDEMVAGAHEGKPDARLDPDQVALELLKSELGARPVEGGL